MNQNVMNHYQERETGLRRVIERIDRFLTGRLPSPSSSNTMSYCRIASVKRYQIDNQEFARSVAGFYAIAAKLNVRVVLLWTALPGEELSLDLGIETPFSQDVSRAMADQVRGITFARTDFSHSWNERDTLWGLDGICCGPEISGVDCALSGLKPGNALLLVLNPANNVKERMKHSHQLSSEVSLYQNMNMQTGSGTQVSDSDSHTHTRACGTISTRMESVNNGETRTQTAGSSDGSSTGAAWGISVGSSRGQTSSASVAQNNGTSSGRTNGNTQNTSEADGTTRTQTSTSNDTRSFSASFSAAAMAVHQLAARCGRYLRGRSSGMVSAAVYCFAPECKARVLLSQINGMLNTRPASGNTADDVFSEIRPAGDLQTLKSIISTGCHPVNFGQDCLPVEIPCFLPMRERAGIDVDFTAEYARNIVFNNPTRTAPIRIGRIMEENHISERPAELDSNTFNEHMLFCGATGCGKTTAITNLVCMVQSSQPHVHFLAIDPKDTLMPQDFLNGATLYVTRADVNANILRLQPFAVPAGISLSTHIDKLSSLFQSCWSMSAAMPDILRQALTKSYQRCGWDLNHNVRIRVPGMPVWPSFALLEAMTREIIENGGFSKRTEADYEGALLTRLHTMSTNTCAQIFRSDDAVPFEELYDRDVIIHCHSLSGETLSLTMSLLLLQMNEFRASVAAGRRNLPLQHITIFEEAHHLAPRVSVGNDNPESVNIGSKSTEAVAMLLAEARDKGECCILSNQTIHEISQSAIDNTASKVIFQIAGKDDIEDVTSALALNTAPVNGINQALGLARLCKYEALVYQRDWNSAPVKVHLDNNPLATDTVSVPVGTAEECKQWVGRVLNALILSPSAQETMHTLQELMEEASVAPQFRHDVKIRLDKCLSADDRDRPALLRHLLLLFFDGLTDILLGHYAGQPDALINAVAENLSAYADVSGLTDSDRIRLAQEILVAEKERGRQL